MTYGWTGVCHPVFRKVPSSNYRNLVVTPTFMTNFGGKRPIFGYFTPISRKPTRVYGKSAEIMGGLFKILALKGGACYRRQGS